jgi:hypothetical protein
VIREPHLGRDTPDDRPANGHRIVGSAKIRHKNNSRPFRSALRRPGLFLLCAGTAAGGAEQRAAASNAICDALRKHKFSKSPSIDMTTQFTAVLAALSDEV